MFDGTESKSFTGGEDPFLKDNILIGTSDAVLN